MSYSHQMDQIRLDPAPVTGVGLTLGAGADLGAFSPGLQPVNLRGIGITVTTTCTVTAPVIGLYKRPVAGATGGAVLIASITAALAAWVAGRVIYKMLDDTITTDLIIRPGEDVFCEVITPPTAGAAFAGILIDPNWDTPSNNSLMTVSTT